MMDFEQQVRRELLLGKVQSVLSRWHKLLAQQALRGQWAERDRQERLAQRRLRNKLERPGHQF
jgi:hypothetical protein